ncbi:MAG: polyphosphate kinase 1 [Actinomycetes bacterium]
MSGPEIEDSKRGGDIPLLSGPEMLEEFGYRRFSNRELSRLDFGSRLLDLAEDRSLALLERVKFVAIFSELLDEFFQVRVAGLEDQVVGGVRTRSIDGLRAGEQLEVIRERVLGLAHRQDRIFLDELIPGLVDAGIRFSAFDELDDDDRRFLDEVFERQIFPVLTPLAVDPGHPFPNISNLSLNLAVQLEDPVTGESRIARVKVPPILPRFVVMPDGERFIALEKVIAAYLDRLFPGMAVGRHEAFRVTRNADLMLEEDEADDLLVALEVELRRRRFGRAVRLEMMAGANPEIQALLAHELDLAPSAIYALEAPVGLGGLWALYSLDRPDLHEETWSPVIPPELRGPDGDRLNIFDVLKNQDILVHHPYDSFSASVEAFISQAAADPNVMGIKQTLYRTSGDSPIVASLIRAAEDGKQVAALVELQARFDEAANIGWAKTLEDAGVHVVYGVMGYKTHSKTALVLRREGDQIRRYCHIGTGNYNSRTARVYEDVGLLTASEDIANDVGDLFNFLTGFSRHSSYRELLVSPATLRAGLIERIEAQAALGAAGRISFKANGLTDPAMIDALYLASQAGVRIDLAIRGMCCLRPGLPGLSESISVRSIVGEFLEHSRIYAFGEPAIDETFEIFIGSADLMERNLDRRIEALVPIHDDRLRQRLVEILDLTMNDDSNTWLLGPDQRWRRITPPGTKSVQRHLKEMASGELRFRGEL